MLRNFIVFVSMKINFGDRAKKEYLLRSFLTLFIIIRTVMVSDGGNFKFHFHSLDSFVDVMHHKYDV
jgi:hypothetical protein